MEEIELDKLLEIIESSNVTVKETKLDLLKPNHLKTFVNEMGLENGNTRVPSYVLFYLYRQVWNGVHVNNKLSRLKFFIQISKVFNKYRQKKQRYYMLKSIPKGGEELLKRAKRYDEKYQKEEKTKKQSKISKSRS